MAVTQKVALYNNKFTVPPVINAVQNDTDRQVEAYFGDFTLQVGMTGKLSFIRSDGTHYEVSATLNTGANTATAELDQALTQAGVTQAQLKITDSGNVGSTFTFMIKVQPDVAGISVPQDGWSAQEFDQRLTDAENAIDAVEEDVADLQDKEYDYAPVITDTASGAIASFPDGADGYPLKECVVDVDAVQDLHGYDHPWPAGGGKNLLNNTAVSTTNNGVIFTVNDDGTVSTSGTADGTAVLRIYQTFSETSDLILNGCPAGGDASTGYSMICATSNGSGVGQVDVGNGANIPANSIPTIAQVQIIVRNGTNVNGKVFKPMVRLASVTDSTYAPYSNICPISGWSEAKIYVQPTVDPTAPPTVTIDLDGTRYGGTLDVTRGKLNENWIHRAITENDDDIIKWTGGTGTHYFVINLGGANTAVDGAIICDRLPTVTLGIGNQNEGIWYVYSSSAHYTRILIRPTGYQESWTVDDFKTWLHDNPLDVIYQRTVVNEYDLDPTEITTLLGTNNVWADTGDIEVEYCADTKRYIQKLISQLA